MITNSGEAEARDIFVSFNKMLPLDTKVQANPELGITIQESERPPNPRCFLKKPNHKKHLQYEFRELPRRIALISKSPPQMQITCGLDNKFYGFERA